MKKQIKQAMVKAENLYYRATPALMGTAIGAVTTANIVYATGGGAALFNELIGLVAKIITALGAVYGVMGIVHYAEANSDGDGPAKKKAMSQMASAVMIIVLSVVITKSNIGNLIATS